MNGWPSRRLRQTQGVLDIVYPFRLPALSLQLRGIRGNIRIRAAGKPGAVNRSLHYALKTRSRLFRKRLILFTSERCNRIHS
jgi:hypothetical protein